MSLDCLTSPHPPAGRRDLPTPISMASIHIVAAQSFILSIPTPAMGPNKALFFHANAHRRSSWRGGGAGKIGSLWSTVRRREEWGLAPVADELDVIPAQSGGATDRRLVAAATKEEEGIIGPMDWKINAAIVLAAGSFAITKLVTIDSDYWHGWTIYEILRYAPEHNWSAYEEALKTNPVLAKMMISGIVYSIGDWIAQCYEGKPLFEFDRARTFRSGLVGFALHGSLSHFYYQLCEALFPFHDWWVVPAKVIFDQTIWSGVWNSIYYTLVGFLRLESPSNIYSELKATFWSMLTAGWKLWPFAHLITYGVIPVEQRLLWVDCVELIWVTILSTYSNEKSKAISTSSEAKV